jgi:ribonuclease HII
MRSAALNLPSLDFEQALWSAGCACVAGIDEAGRGALAGPVAAAAVILPADPGISRALSGVRDSKQMTPSQRILWMGEIYQVATAAAVGIASNQEIDALGILPATRLAAQRALQGLVISPQHLLLDWLFLPEVDLPQTSLAKGDQRVLSIAAASVLAKTARDTLLQALDCEYPGYGLKKHKGYGTSYHLAALHSLGPCPIHRHTFKPVQALVFQTGLMDLSTH